MMTLMSVGYTVLALFMEFNSVFLHARKLLKFYQFKRDSLIVRINKILNILSFLFFRFGVLIAVLCGIIYDGHRVSIAYLVALSLGICIMSTINIVLFKRLLVKDFLTKRSSSSSNSDKSNIIDSKIVI